MTQAASVSPDAIKSAAQKLDAHVREIIQWHFSPETGCPFWLDWAKKNFDPRSDVKSFADLIARGEPGLLARPYALERFTTGALIDEHGAAGVAH